MRMLHRGGWSSSAGAYGGSIDFPNHTSSGASNQSEEWLISRKLARQCALASDWTGNGLDSRSVLVENSQIDLIELAKEDSTTTSDQCGILVFSTSQCGRFMLAARDALVYIYESKDGSLVPITTLVCPRQVLSMSMAASSGRGAVAMLLEGRLGMVCDLGYGCECKHQCQERVSGENCPASKWSCGLRCSFLDAQKDGTEQITAVELRSDFQRVGLEDVHDPRTHELNLVNPTWTLDVRGPSSCRTPIVCGKSAFYRHLCSWHDPPRSISVCSQRRCVAFGCSVGIELHWINAVTGQNLSR
jgi:hypothetical protein